VIRLGGIQAEKIPLLKKLARRLDAPTHRRARLITTGRPTHAHSGDLRAVTLKIGSDDPRHQRAARFKFGKLLEKVISMPSPAPLKRTSGH
jgi:hypothetical protein